jgi:hypothetical protein
MILTQNHREGGSEHVQYRPQLEPLDIGRFFASLRFKNKRKLDQLGVYFTSYPAGFITICSFARKGEKNLKNANQYHVAVTPGKLKHNLISKAISG